MAQQIDALVTQNKPRVLAVDMSRVPDIEYSALQALMEGEKRATEARHHRVAGGAEPRRHGGRCAMPGMDQRLGRERMLFNARAAIERYQALQTTGGIGSTAAIN